MLAASEPRVNPLLLQLGSSPWESAAAFRSGYSYPPDLWLLLGIQSARFQVCAGGGGKSNAHLAAIRGNSSSLVLGWVLSPSLFTPSKHNKLYSSYFRTLDKKTHKKEDIKQLLLTNIMLIYLRVGAEPYGLDSLKTHKGFRIKATGTWQIHFVFQEIERGCLVVP